MLITLFLVIQIVRIFILKVVCVRKLDMFVNYLLLITELLLTN